MKNAFAENQKGISLLISSVLLVMIAIVAALIVGSFMSTTATTSSETVENQTKQRLECSYAGLYIVNATYDCNSDCAAGTNHTINVTVKNSGQVKLSVEHIYIQNTSGHVFSFGCARNISTGERVTLTNTSDSACTGINGSISKIYITSTNCPFDATDQIEGDDPNLYSVNC